MTAFTPRLSLPYESPNDLPGGTITGSPDGQTPILAREVERVLTQSSHAIAQGRYTPVFAGDSSVLDPGGGAGHVSGAWHRTGFKVTGWARFRTDTGVTYPSGVVRVFIPFDPDTSIMDVATSVTGRTFVVGNGYVESDVFDGIVYTRIVPNDVGGLITGTHVMRCMEYNSTNSLDWSVFSGTGQELTINFTYVIDPASV